MNITSFREMPKGEQFQALAEILSQVASYRVVENSIEKKGMDVVFTYVVPDFDDDELMEFKRELDVMGFTTEIEEIDNELNLLVYPYKGIPSEAFEYLDEWTNPEDFDNWDEEGNRIPLPGEKEEDWDDEEWTDPAGGTHSGNEEDPAHQYESLDDSKYIIDSLFEDEDDEGDLKFPDDFAKDDEELPDDFGEEIGDEDEVEVVDGEAIEKLPGEDEEIDDLFGDMEDNDDFISDEEPFPGSGDDDLIHNDLFGDEEMPTDDGEFGELEPEPLMPDTDQDTNVDVKVDVEVDTEEAKMVKSQLINIKKSVDELLASIKPGQDMEPWVQAKLTLAQDYLQTVKNRLLDVDDEMNEDEEAKYFIDENGLSMEDILIKK